MLIQNTCEQYHSNLLPTEEGGPNRNHDKDTLVAIEHTNSEQPMHYLEYL